MRFLQLVILATAVVGEPGTPALASSSQLQASPSIDIAAHSETPQLLALAGPVLTLSVLLVAIVGCGVMVAQVSSKLAELDGQFSEGSSRT